jgi:hypothetical protein
MVRVGFEPTTPVFERVWIINALDRAATVISVISHGVFPPVCFFIYGCRFWAKGEREGKINLSLCLIKRHAMKTNEGMEILLQAFLTVALEGVEQSASHSNRFTLGTHMTGGWIDPQTRFGLCGEERFILPLPGIEPRFLGRPSCILIIVPNELSRHLWQGCAKYEPAKN